MSWSGTTRSKGAISSFRLPVAPTEISHSTPKVFQGKYVGPHRKLGGVDPMPPTMPWKKSNLLTAEETHHDAVAGLAEGSVDIYLLNLGQPLHFV